jgi:hypothetical protein
MNRLKSLAWRVIWAGLVVVSITGCASLKGFGKGLGDVFKGIKLP